MKKPNRTRIFWGISIVIIALLLIFNAVGQSLGILDIGGLPVIRIVLGGIFLAYAIAETVKGKPQHIFFPLAFIVILFKSELLTICGINPDSISSWLILAVALLLTVGVSMLIPHKSKYKINGEFVIDNNSSDKKNIENNLSEKTQYIDCTDFNEMRIENNLGSLSVYFTNVESFVSGSRLVLENNLGSINLHIPAAWKCDCKFDNTIGKVNFPKERTAEATAQLNIVGENNLGLINVQYC